MSEIQKVRPNIGVFADNIACGFFEFWTCGARLLIAFLELFAVLSLTAARDNSTTTQYGRDLFSFYRLGTNVAPWTAAPLLALFTPSGRGDRNAM